MRSAFEVEHGDEVSKGASYMAARMIRAGKAMPGGAKTVGRNMKADFKFGMKRDKVSREAEQGLRENSRVGRRSSKRQSRWS